METYDHLIKYNDDDSSVSVPFGRAAEYYISKHPLLKNIRLKARSRLRTPQLIKEGIITLKRVEGAVDFVEWTTSNGNIKSTNRIDDVIELTPKGNELVEKISSGKAKDKLCWSWVMYCAGDGNTCQHLCGGIGKCNPDCPNANLPNNLKNSNDRHRCRLRVVSESRLSWINTPHQLRIKIDGWHIPPNALVVHSPQVTRVNLTRSARDQIIISRRADRWTADDVKTKILVSKKGATEADLNQDVVKNRDICNSKQLKRLIVRDDRRVKDNSGPWTVLQHYIQDVLKPRGHVLYYQNPNLSAEENSPDRYYQLIVSDDLWLINGRDFGQHFFCIDGNNDLNMDRATVLTMVVETKSGHLTPLAFALSNGDDKIPVRAAISAIKANLPCNNSDCSHSWHYKDLPNDKGFQRVRECSSINSWNPIAMIDQHLPIMREIENDVRGTILSWTHIMLKLAEKFKIWDVPKLLRYPIAMGFKIVGRSRSEEEADASMKLFKNFIDALPIGPEQKSLIKNELENNWMSDEWRDKIIDSGRIFDDLIDEKPMTSNNLTEIISRKVEAQLDGKMTPLAFLERLFGVKLRRDSLHADDSPVEQADQSSLVALLNAQSIAQQDQSERALPADIQCHLNLGRLYFLYYLVEPAEETNYYYVKKINEASLTFTSPYDGKQIQLDANAMESLKPMINSFTNRQRVAERKGYYIVNIKTGECSMCLDFIWHGRFRSVCKHCHAARIYAEGQQLGDFTQIIKETKQKLVEYFRSREDISQQQRNIVIFQGSIEEAYLEIVRLYSISGDKIFDPPGLKDYCRDPLRNFKSKRRNSVKPNGPSKPNKRVRTKEINIDQQVEFSEATQTFFLNYDVST
ncbi:hypothetical protein C2G38_2156710 [Gigaspora rosea]|uniref:Uncharacterized protein n=1 Tax=Gigaspora rosea TaxID=44941 RepID=A0A397W2E9_9GLOM|nr:hypothetical protein C2G38_2156710 [Gigaspora rosea]